MSDSALPPRVSVKYECTSAEFTQGQSMLVTAERQAANLKAKSGRNGEPPKVASANQFTFGRNLFGWMLFVGLAILFFMLMRTQHSTGAPRPPQKMVWEGIERSLGLYVLLLGVVAFLAGVVLMRIARHKNMATRTDDFTYEITEIGIVVRTSRQKSTWAWERFHSFAHNDSILVLRTSPSLGIILPLRLFTPEQVQELINFLNQRLAIKVPTLHGGFEVVQP